MRDIALRNSPKYFSGVRRGFTLVEMIVYIAIFSILSLSAVNGTLQTMKAFYSMRAAQNVNQSATTALDRMVFEIRNAYDIDRENSTLGTSPGRLMLLVKDASGNSNTVEFYVASKSPAMGTVWTQASTSQNYMGIAMSSDGKYQTVVVWSGYIYISSDYGTTWTQKGSSNSYGGVGMSLDGKYQTAAVNGGSLLVSSDYGNTWATKGTSHTYMGVSLSSDGKYQTAVSNGYIYVSSDYGNTWAQKGNNIYYRAVKISSDGKYQTAVVWGDYLYTSSDYGNTWTQNTTALSTYRSGIAMSSDGKYQTTGSATGGLISISSDYGITWTQKSTGNNYSGFAMTSDGKYQTAVVNGGYIYISSDYGITWTQQGTSQVYKGVAMSSDGKYETAISNGYIYESIYNNTDQLGVKVAGVDQGSLMVSTASLAKLIFTPISTPNSVAVKIDMDVQDSRQDIIKKTSFHDTIILRGSVH